MTLTQAFFPGLLARLFTQTCRSLELTDDGIAFGGPFSGTLNLNALSDSPSL